MDSATLKQIIDMEMACTAVCCQVKTFSWGLAYFNPTNAQHYDANSAHSICTTDPAATIREIIDFYRAQGLLPRVRVNSLTEPHDLVSWLENYGFWCTPFIKRVLFWDGTMPVAQDSDILIRPATASDQETLAYIIAKANSYQVAWIDRYVGYELASSQVHYFLAYWQGEPVACIAYMEFPLAGFIIDVATLPDYQRRGLATAMVTYVQQLTAKPLFLEVIRANAERIYNRAGFRYLGQIQETVCFLHEK